MNNEIEFIVEVWEKLKDFISNKDKSEAAELMVRIVADNLSENDLRNLALSDSDLADAVDLVRSESEDDDHYDEE